MLHIFIREQSTEYREQRTENREQSKVERVSKINFVDFRLRSLQKLKRAWFSLACSKILPLRRGSGSDEVDDEGVETSGKAESRKKKVEIANSLAMSISQLPPKKHLLFLVPLPRGTIILLIQRTYLPPHSTHQTYSEKDRHRKG